MVTEKQTLASADDVKIKKILVFYNFFGHYVLKFQFCSAAAVMFSLFCFSLMDLCVNLA